MVDVEEQLQRLEEQLMQSAFRQSCQFMSSVLADKFREFGTSGCIWKKKQTLDALRDETSAYFLNRRFEAAVLSPGVALVTCRIVRHVPASGEISVSLRSSVRIWRDGRWQMLFHQGTPVADRNTL